MATKTYKHLETIEFKGITWKYDKTFGEWRPVGRKEHKKYPTVFSIGDDLWRVVGYIHSDTPLGALQNWVKGEIVTLDTQIDDLEGRVAELKSKRLRLRSKSWV